MKRAVMFTVTLAAVLRVWMAAAMDKPEFGGSGDGPGDTLINRFLHPAAAAAVPQLINYQGWLTENGVNPVADGDYSLTFKIYNDSTAGTVLWTETQVVRGFEPEPRFTVYPTVDSRYRVRVRCSSQPEGGGCAGAAEARVLVTQAAAGGKIVLGPDAVTCATEADGDAEICDPLDPLRFEFAMPTQGAGAAGLDLLRFARADLRSPELAPGSCVASGLGVGAATGDPLAAVASPAFPPAAGEAAYYLLAHRVESGAWPAGSARIGGVPSPRLVSAGCP